MSNEAASGSDQAVVIQGGAKRIEELTGIAKDLFWFVVFLSWLPFISSNGVVFSSLVFDPATEKLVGVIPLMPYFPGWVLLVFVAVGLAGTYANVIRPDADASKRPGAGWLLAALLPYIPLALFTLVILPHSDLGPGGDDGRQTVDTNLFSIFGTLYLLSLLASLVSFVRFGRLGDDHFFLFCIIMFFDILLTSFDIRFTFFGIILQPYVPSPLGLVFAFLTVFLVYALRLAWRDNRAIWDERPKLIRLSARKAFMLWLPMFAVFALMAGFYWYLETRHFVPATIEYLHNFERQEALVQRAEARAGGDPEADPETIVVPPPNEAEKPKTIREATVSLIGRIEADLKAKTEAAIGDARSGIASGSDEARKEARNSIERALPERLPGTKTEKCKWYKVVCHLKNGVKSMANSAYQNAKERQLNALQRELDELHRKQGELGDSYKDRVNEAIDYRIGLVASTATTATNQIARTLTLVRYAFALYTFLVLLKGYAIIFARVFYARIPFGEHASEDTRKRAEQPKFGKITKFGEIYDIPKDSQVSFYARTRYSGSTVIERKRIPQFTRLALSRVLSRTYVMNYVDTSFPGQGACHLRVNRMEQIIEWKLVKGEEVVFHVRDLVAMSSTITLSRRVSVRLASLIFGRIIYHYAVGPGVLLLRTQGEAIAGKDQDATEALSIYGFRAWNTRNEFWIRASENHIDTYFSGCNLKAGERNLIVYDTSRNLFGNSALGGVWKLCRSFLLPF